MSEARPPESRVSMIFRTFCVMPMFLMLTVIFWELVLGMWLLSGWFYEKGWNVLGFSTRVAWILLAVFTIFLTLKVFIGWIVRMIHVIRG
jgi:hypothetical protein